MLERAVAAVKADKDKPIECSSPAKVAFKDRNLFTFCSNLSGGKFVAARLLALGGHALLCRSMSVISPPTWRTRRAFSRR